MSGFDSSKRYFLERLLSDVKSGRVDFDIADHLLSLNKLKCVFTTSSCSGRVVVIYSNDFRDKRNARIIEGWHDPAQCRLNICRYSSFGYDEMFYYWISLQPPIIHLVARDVKVAETLLACGDKSGFSKLGYRMYRSGGYHVVVGVGDKSHVILPADCSMLLTLCDMLGSYKEKLYSFFECTSNINC